MEKRYFHHFNTIDYVAAVEFYEAIKFTIWSKKEEGDAEGNQEDHKEEEEGDSREHAAKHKREEQRQAETDVQGQDDGHNVRNGNGDFKDNDDQPDNKDGETGNQDIAHSS